MMELKVSEWKEFQLDRLFILRGGFYNKKPEHSIDGCIPFLGSTENDNGVTEFYSLDDIRAWNKVGLPDNSFDGKLFDGGCVAITVNGSVCNAFYQSEQFTCSHDITALYIPDFFMSEAVGLFIASVIMKDKYRWSYGRKPHSIEKFGKSIISLPIQHDTSGQPLIDPLKKYSDDGYVPDWDFMERYMKSLNMKLLVTQKNGAELPALGIEKWKEFRLDRLMVIRNGKGITDNEICDNPGTLQAVQGGENNNGILGLIDEDYCRQQDYVIIDKPCLTVARVGTAGFVSFHDTCVVGDKAKALLFQDCDNKSVEHYLFIASILNQNRYKYNYGRGLVADVYMRETLRLPIQYDVSGNPLIDPSKKYSDDGYIPDWAFMEQYIGSLPGSDLI